MQNNINRRKFIETSMIMLGGITLQGFARGKNKIKPVRFGIVTDIHHSRKNPPEGSNRYYGESLDKLKEFISVMNKEKVDFIIELGDLKDEGTEPQEKETLGYLREVEKIFQEFNGPKYHVLGNHDMDSISKEQFLENISNSGFKKALPYYSFDINSFHFIVLDANYRFDGTDYNHGNFDWKEAKIPQEQLTWLKNDLGKNKNPAIIFVHHQLDSSTMENKNHCPENADEVRKILEEGGNVIGVFQGHNHRGHFSRIENIFYYTLKSVVEGTGTENNNFAIVNINEKLEVKFKGYRKTEDLKI